MVRRPAHAGIRFSAIIITNESVLRITSARRRCCRPADKNSDDQWRARNDPFVCSLHAALLHSRVPRTMEGLVTRKKKILNFQEFINRKNRAKKISFFPPPPPPHLVVILFLREKKNVKRRIDRNDFVCALRFRFEYFFIE